jgi:asparagine synthase (glutamine-hydrolysing)
MNSPFLREVVDLTDPATNVVFNMTVDEARQRVASGDVEQVRQIDGHFALLAQRGVSVRLARSLQTPLRYFIAKLEAGPTLVVAHRIDALRDWLASQGLQEQFHPSYTRMVPAHHITTLQLVGCPDPNPTYERFLTPARDALPTDLDLLGRQYVGQVRDELHKWLRSLPATAPIGVCFSAGIDSGCVFLLTLHLLQELGLSPARLKAFTLALDGDGRDLRQARQFLDELGLGLYQETIDQPVSCVDYREAVRTLEDYKPLDLQAGAMNLALFAGIRQRYPDWVYLLDGDGGDENLKDYPIDDYDGLTIRSVLGNPLLYQEGRSVQSIKHSLTYSGGLSRGCTRGFAPARKYGFRLFSPFSLPEVVACAEGIPFVALTEWDPERLYPLKGEIVARGIREITGLEMPIFPKRRFQQGAGAQELDESLLPSTVQTYRRAFDALFQN